MRRMAVWFSVLTLVAGCESLGGPNAPAREAGDQVVMIRQYYAANPWVRDDDGRVNGLQARVYFAAAAKDEGVPKGVFVPGPIRAALYVLVSRPDGGYQRELAHQWTFDEQEAAGYRITHSSRMGDSYGLVLRWPPAVNVAGREIQIEFSYQRKDGKVIAERGSRFRIPLPLGPLEPQPWQSGRAEPGGDRNAPTTRPQTRPGAG